MNDFDHVSTDDLLKSKLKCFSTAAVAHLIVALLLLCRFVGQTTKHMIHHVNSLPLNATWRAQREDTDSIWTTLGHANVRVNHDTEFMV